MDGIQQRSLWQPFSSESKHPEVLKDQADGWNLSFVFQVRKRLPFPIWHLVFAALQSASSPLSISLHNLSTAIKQVHVEISWLQRWFWINHGDVNKRRSSLKKAPPPLTGCLQFVFQRQQSERVETCSIFLSLSILSLKSTLCGFCVNTASG